MSIYLLWDVDGTLVFNGSDAGNLYHEAVELAAGHAIEVRLPNRHGKTDGQVLTETLEAHGLDPRLHSSAVHHLDELSRLRHEAGNHRVLAPGVSEILAATAERGWINALLTGNSESRSRYKLTGAGLNSAIFDWEHSYFGSRTPVRSELTLRAAEQLAGNTVIIIGDTPGDGIAADAAGFPLIAVATGVYSVEDLRLTSAVTVVDDLDTGFDAVLAAIERLAEGR